MNLIELNRSLVQLRLSGMAAVLETRLLQAQSETMAPIDLISILVSDELACRSKRLLERRHKQAQFRDPNKLLDNFDFQFNPKMNRSLVFDLATAAWIGRREDALFLGPAGSGKSHFAQAIGHAVIQQGYRVLYREAHILLEELADATLDGNRKQHMELLTTVPLLIIDDLGMRKLPLTAAEELLEIIMRRYERTSTLITSNRPVDDWGKLLGDSAAVSAMLDRLAAPRTRAQMRPAQLANQDRQSGRKPMTKPRTAKAIRMPGKERPAASRLGIQGPPTTEPHHRNTGRNTKPSDRPAHRANCRGSRLPIPSEPAPCHRPWITPQGATPAKRVHTTIANTTSRAQS